MSLTPMMQQYFRVKENHKDHIVFYRLGDFYEMFFEDALVASKELELTLTGRECGLEERAPMCGVPFHSAEGYIAKLIRKGYKVAVCEQVEDPATAKGLVSREVVRVITPGTLMESNLLEEDANNFLCSIYVAEDGYGLAFADISTGEVNLTQTDTTQNNVVNELTRYMPKEIIFNDGLVDKVEITSYMKDHLQCTADLLDMEEFDKEEAIRRVFQQFEVKELESLGIGTDSLALNALGALLGYLHNTQKTGIERLVTVNIIQDHLYMNLDYNARTNLELLQTLRTQEKRGSLLWVLDKTKTPMGKRLIRNWLNQPLVNPLAIEKRLNAVEELFQNELFAGDLSEILSGIFDLERLLTRIVYGSATPREYKTLEQTLKQLPSLKEQLSKVKAEYLKYIYQNINPLEELSSYLEHAILEEPSANARDGGIIQAGFSEELDELHSLVSNAKEHLRKLEEKERESTKIKNLKVGYNKVFGYYFEVTRSYLDLVPEHYIRKQTLANCERYITQELKELEDKILHAHEKSLVLEQQLFEVIRQRTIEDLHHIQQTAIVIGQLDVFLSFAKVSRDNQYVRPVVELSQRIDIKEGRHPVVEKMLDGVPFVPNDTLLDCGENQIGIITGPNMAGKSTYMRQTAIIVLMAQLGCFVPASSATIGIVDGIYTRIGASDDLTAGESTFMVEMKEVSAILKNATSNSLLILDEIGRGTSTYDGMSIARAVIEYIANPKKMGAKTLFATHYHELTAMEGVVSGVKNYHIAARKHKDDIIFLRRIIRGGTDDSYGIEVSKLAGVPSSVIKRAYDILEELESQQPIQHTVVVQESPQMQLGATVLGQDPIREMLNLIDVEALTPIEALNKLYELKTLQKEEQ